MLKNSPDSTARVVRLGLLWHSPNSGNLGVGALTVSHIALIDRAAAAAGVRIEYTILGFVDPDTPFYVDRPDVSVVALNTRAMLAGGAYGKALADLDAVLDIGGGDSFADIYGAKRFAFLLGSKVMAQLRRLPLVLAPQTIGPFTRQPYRKLATIVMRSARMVVVRDPQSFDAVQAMAARIPLMQAVDVAFALPFDQPQRDGAGPVRVGINVSGLLFSGGYSGKNEFGLELDYADYTRRLVSHLLGQPGIEVWLISHVNSNTMPRDDDRLAIATIHAEQPRTKVAPYFASPSAAKTFIASLDFLVAGRMHACIAAYSAGVPVVPVSYSRKFSGLFCDLLGYEFVLPVRGMDTDAALAFTLETFGERETIRRSIGDSSSKIEQMLARYVEYLTQLLGEIAVTMGRS